MTDVPGRPALVARDAEVADLQGLLQGVGEHGPALVLVTGRRGSGTTAVVDALAAGHDGVVLRASAVPWEHDVDLGVLAQLMGTRVPAADPVTAAGLFVDALPGGGGPVLVVVDDVAWADPSSVQALSTAVRHRPDGRFLVVLAGATDDATTPRDTARVLERVDRVVRLGDLSTADVQALAAAHGVGLHPTLADRLRRFTGGRPGPVAALLAEQPPAFWSGHDPVLPAPRALVGDVRCRVAELDDRARSLVEAVAVLGEEPLPVVATLAGTDEPYPALDAAVAAGLVRVAGPAGAPRVGPADPMVRAAVLAGTGAERRGALHRAAAELVDDPVARLLHRVEATPLPDPALADELESLARERAGTGEWASVADLLTRAARLTAEPALREDRLARAFDALVGAGDTQGAAAAVAEVESLRETPLRNAVLGYLAVVRGRPVEAEARLQPGLGPGQHRAATRPPRR